LDWPQKLSAAVDYIESNLDSEISIVRAAEIACCSTFYFQRLFLVISGITLAEYIRRRRLTLAATDLASGDNKVIDIAMKYGYDSPDAFTRAFRNMHGITPQTARKPGKRLEVFPRISFQVIMNGGTDMDYRIEKKQGFSFAGRTRQFTTVNGENFQKIPVWWQEFTASPECNQVRELCGNKPGKVTGGAMLGICFGDADAVEFSYGIGVEILEGKASGNFEKINIPQATWAVFDCTLDNLQEITKRIFSDWFPSTGYEHDDAPELEVYLPEKPGEPMNCELWFPVKKK